MVVSVADQHVEHHAREQFVQGGILIPMGQAPARLVTIWRCMFT